MAKWANYCIYAVKYNEDHTHIVKVKAYEDKGDSFGDSKEMERLTVIAFIGAGLTFVTIYKNNGDYKKGEDVRIVTVNGTKYIRTDANSTAADNLGNLPEY